ncbi:FAD:protein FMN transferase [Maritalea mediterranea]|uniref:FAD:protein FMN transferase n=1 Tax=Maritalea mediterranea TaxID=2909667 RepID=A0ABS9E6F4_9HYPH|nr:FAD:protein FMN transferase [Maritalea mediterranea]MCF4098368.1 FAD:protein FMN transferase [Maritalea mediterranea]
MLTRRKFLALSAGGLALTSLPASAQDIATIGGAAFGTYWRLSAANIFDGKQLTARFNQTIQAVDKLFSPYLANSTLCEFNRQASTNWIQVPPPLHRLVSASLALAERSNGAFDPTIGPNVARYGFGPITGRSGRYNEISLTPGKIRKARVGLTLDLCGIAKGYALDQLRADLAAFGLTDYLLDLGGEVAAHGLHPSGRPWQVGVETPDAKGLAHIVALNGQSVATSGLGVQSYKPAGLTYGHIINPQTGAPMVGRTRSVSVMAEKATLADGWATALMAMSEEEAIGVAEREGLDALFLLKEGDRLRPVFTGNFAQWVIA